MAVGLKKVTFIWSTSTNVEIGAFDNKTKHGGIVTTGNRNLKKN